MRNCVRLRRPLPPLALAALIALLLLPALAPGAKAAEASRPVPVLDRGLELLDGGRPVPLLNRPHRQPVGLAERLRGAPPAAPREYVEPREFGVLLEFDGTRADLEAAGIRVASQVGNTFTARLRRGEFARLRTLPGLRRAQLARYLEPHLNVSAVDVRSDLEHGAVGSPPFYTGRAGRGIIIGDIDTGVDIYAGDLKDSLGQTRILYIWDQNDAGGPSPAGFGYGSEWTKAQIDGAPGSVRHQDTDGHGTLVAGVLAGSGVQTGCSQPAYRYVGMAPQADYIEVSTDFSDAGIIDGVNYVFQKAAALGRDAVVNLSLGGHFGPHDGSDVFSSSISGLSGPGRIIVASAGNDQQSNIHGKLITTSLTVGVDRMVVSVPSYVRKAGTFNDYFLVTGWYDAGASFSLRLKGPLADDTLSIGMNQMKERLTGSSGKIFMANQVDIFSGTPTSYQFEIEVYDSVALNSPRAGNWEISVVPNGAANIGERVDIWVYASWLGASGQARVSTGLDLTTLVGGPGDGDSVFTVAAHATKAQWYSCLDGGTCGYVTPPTLGAIASFSSHGPRRDGVLKPEISAPGFGVASTHSAQSGPIQVCGSVDDGVHEVTQGTSFSAPHVSGAAALYLQAFPGASPSQVKQAFTSRARVDGYTGVVPNATWGYGKLDIYGAFDHTAPAVALTAPNGGESWAGGSAQNVLWTATDSAGVTAVDLAYSTDGGATYPNVIATGIANTGSYPWSVPAIVTSTARVRVTAHDAAGNSGTDASAADFAITGANTPPVVSITAPVGGETWGTGTAQNITWTASDDLAVTAIDLDYSTDGGATYPHSIASGLANSGSYAWSVPHTPTVQARVRVTAHDAATTAAAASAADFTIADGVAPAVAVLAPVGGEEWLEGTTQNITWSASDNVAVDSVNVDYSVDGAAGPWMPVAHGLANSGSYAWSVPTGATDSALVRITAFDGAGNQTADESDSLFHITTLIAVGPGARGVFALASPVPNPTVGPASMRFRLPAAAPVTVEVLGVNGDIVWRRAMGTLAAGDHSVTWAGDGHGESRVAPGLYFVRVTSPFGTRTAKLLRLR